MEKPYFYHRFKVEMPIRNGYYENFVTFLKEFCSLRDIRIEWVRNVEGAGYTSVTFILHGDYLLPTTLVSLGRAWQSELCRLSIK